MEKKLYKFTLILLIGLLISCDSNTKTPEEKSKMDFESKDLEKPNDIMQKLSYTYGNSIGKSLVILDSNYRYIDYDYLIQGILDELNKNQPLLNELEMMVVQDSIMQMQMRYTREEYAREFDVAESLSEEFKTTVPKFLQENAKKDGWVVLPSGLQYKVVEKGSGEKPKTTDVVQFHAIGKLVNGKEFENTYKAVPIEIPVEGMIPGWYEAFNLMSVGAKYELVIPPHLAFGEKGSPPRIPGNSALIMEVEFLDILGHVKDYKPRNAPGGPPPNQQPPQTGR